MGGSFPPSSLPLLFPLFLFPLFFPLCRLLHCGSCFFLWRSLYPAQTCSSLSLPGSCFCLMFLAFLLLNNSSTSLFPPSIVFTVYFGSVLGLEFLIPDQRSSATIYRARASPSASPSPSDSTDIRSGSTGLSRIEAWCARADA
jgi:hypothetical protein